MATTNPPALARLMDDARTRLPGALDDAIQRELFTTLNEFFQDSNVWREDVLVTTIAGVDSYELVTESRSAINRLLWVFGASGQRVYATLPDMFELKLRYMPTQTEKLTATVALTVIDPVSRTNYPSAPDWVIQKYGTGLLDGVLGRMMSQPAKPYYSQQLAILHTRRFRQTVSMARIEAANQNQYAGHTWTFPRDFATRRR